MARLNVYALGGGLGHAMRMASLARVAVARGHRVHALINASRLSDAALALDGLTLQRVPLDTSREALRALLDAAPRADAWFVDTFPRGILGELDVGALSGRRIWIHRDLAPRYAERPEVRAAAAKFDQVLVPGPDEAAPLADAVRALRTLPWIALDSDQLLEPDQARRAFGVGRERKLVVVSASGTDAEAAPWRALAGTLQAALDAEVRLAELAGPRPMFPLVKYLAGVDLLVGAGGYHTVNEARATATPLLALPQVRTYDRQALRLRDHERVGAIDELIARARVLLEAPRPPVPRFKSGAHQALALVE